MLSSIIPSFVLYGENSRESPPDLAHIETIAVRSALYDWEISPHRHERNVQALLVMNGQVEFRCDGVTRLLDAPCYMVVPIGSVHGFRFTPGTSGYVLTLAAGFASRAAHPGDPLLGLLTGGGCGEVPAANRERVDWLCRELLAVQADWHLPQPLFLALAEALVRSLPSSGSDEAGGEDERHLAAFRRLIELHLRERHELAWYAGRLGMTTKTLTRICRRKLDCTPVELIHARVVLEAQRLLCFTNASIVQVAADLGFSDSSYFSRFYQRLTGHRPREEKSRGKVEVGARQS
ncbi:helix-turn-helix domain-containing protein [Novosphingobium resinovorum]|uniref:helix-turn-helix domain-containing protein n=1 Tax=Novosphingobium resinovorum TaxID=158500 RepID=UPI002ED4E862|nr:helix-turn-helix domain-containing protein [Novosphingobium resinovorum]